MCILLAILLNVPFIISTININQWSLEASDQLLTDGWETKILAPPAEHTQGILWLASQSLADGDAQMAINFIETYGDPTDPIAQHMLGNALAVTGNMPAAFDAWAKSGDHTSLMSAARDALKNDDTDVALLALEKYIQILPHKGDGYFEIGRILTREKPDLRADSWFSTAIALDRSRPFWFISRATNLRDGGDLELALQVFNEAAYLFPTEAGIFYEQSYAYYIAGQYSNAQLTIEKALELESDPPAWYYNRAGLIYEKINQTQKALAAYQAALRIDPKNITALQALTRFGEIP